MKTFQNFFNEHTTLEHFIALDVVVLGLSRLNKFPIMKRNKGCKMICKRCRMEYKPNYVTCETCDGSGDITFSSFSELCHDCLGVGRLSFDAGLCPGCKRLMQEVLVK
jgi:hypothetical protein